MKYLWPFIYNNLAVKDKGQRSMLSDSETQNCQFKWAANLSQGKDYIQIEAKADVRFSGILVVHEGLQIEKVIKKIVNGQVEIVQRRKHQIQIEIGLTTVILKSQQYQTLKQIKKELQSAKLSITHLEQQNQKLHKKIFQLQQKIVDKSTNIQCQEIKVNKIKFKNGWQISQYQTGKLRINHQGSWGYWLQKTTSDHRVIKYDSSYNFNK